MPGRTLLLLGSGPGVGVSVASAFAVRGFTHIALIARNKERLAEDEDRVLTAIQERGYSSQVKTWPCDLTNLDQLETVLKEVESFGSLEVVLFNAARVAGKPPLEESSEAILNDFKTTNIALYEVAKWAIPLLQKNSGDSSPSLFVTSTSTLWKEPVPDLVSLSMVKTAQRALVLSLHSKFGKDVHIGLLSIGGVVSPDAKRLTPDYIAEHAWELYKQPKANWQREIEMPE